MNILVFEYIDKFSYNFSTSCEAPQIYDALIVTLTMNHKYVTLGIVAIIAAIAVTAVGFGTPQQAFAHKHYHHNDGIKVDQSIGQLNACFNRALCLNNANNTADIDR